MRRNKTLWAAALLSATTGLTALTGCGDDGSETATAQPSAGSGGASGAAAGGAGQGGSGGSGGSAAGVAGQGGTAAGTGGTEAGGEGGTEAGGEGGTEAGGEGGSEAGGEGGEAGAGGGAPLAAIIDLRADNNRDGNVDLNDPADDADEETWDKTHGAIFLANIDDDDKNCGLGTKLSDAELDDCNDAADDIINGEDDLLDLARLKTAPWADAPEEVVGRLAVDEVAAPYVHLFKNDGSGNFTIFNPAADVLTAAEVRAGVELAIEATDIVRDTAVWDGYVNLSFDITLGDQPIEGATPDTVRLRVSPVMTHHHLQPTRKAYVAGITGDPGSVAMRADLKAAVTASKVPEGLVELKNSAIAGDQWTQDYFETGYMALPVPGGKHIVRVAYRSANVYSSSSTATKPLRPAGRVVFSTLRGKDFAGVQQYDLKHPGSMDSLNSFGNTETIPPYTLDGKSYPQGRLFRGSVKTFYPDKKFSKMLESQQVQPPVYVDTSWLLVGHVDETISFVKANTPRGWALVINDPALAKKMLEEQVAKGNGDVKLFVGKKWINFNPDKDPQTDDQELPAEVSIKDLLADKDIIAESAATGAEVDNQLAIIQKETGITEDEIIRLPYLHENAEGYSLAHQPGTVNGIYLSDTDFGAPKPHGPMIDGADLFETQMTEAFAKVGIKVHYIEDWDLYHRLSGEVHCGSNVIRDVADNDNWWESGY